MAYVIMELFTIIFNNIFNRIEINMMVSLLGLALLTIIYSASLLEKLSATLLFQTFAIISEILANYALRFIANRQIKNVEMLGLFLSKIILFEIVIITQFFRKKNALPVKYIGLFCFIPMLSSIIIFGIYASPDVYDNYMYLFASSMLFINFIAYYLLNQLAEHIQAEGTIKQLQQQVMIQKEKYAQLTSVYYRGNRILHDVNKHMRMIHHRLEQGEVEETIAYIKTVDDSLERNYNVIHTGNLVIDSILSNMKSRLEDIPCKCDIIVAVDTHRITIDDYDLVIVLGNIADNMIEAVTKIKEAKDRKVDINLSMHHQALLIHARNTMEPRVVQDAGKEQWFHGLGLQNVREVVERYGGSLSVQGEAGWYDTMVRIPVSENVEKDNS